MSCGVCIDVLFEPCDEFVVELVVLVYRHQENEMRFGDRSAVFLHILDQQLYDEIIGDSVS